MRVTYGPSYSAEGVRELEEEPFRCPVVPFETPAESIMDTVRAAKADVQRELREILDEPVLSGHRVPIGTVREEQVESSSVPGQFYTLSLTADGTWHCGCPGFMYRQECKHVRRKQRR